MAKNIQLVIFDLDGTLVDAYAAVSSSLNHALTTFGFDTIDDKTIQQSVGWGEKALVSKFVPENSVDRVLSVYRQHHRNALKTGTKFLPGAKEVLDRLKNEDYILAIASNRPSRFSNIILKQLEINNYFRAVVCADKVAYPKPASDMLDKILKKVGLSPEQALYVGDMTIDVETGKKAGIKTVSILSGSNTIDELEKASPFRIIEHLSEVERVLEELN